MGAAGADRGRADGGMGVERKRRREGGKMTAKGGPFMVVVKVDCRFGRSAKTVSEARITQTGSLHFLMQACRLINSRFRLLYFYNYIYKRINLYKSY